MLEQKFVTFSNLGGCDDTLLFIRGGGGAHCTEIDFVLSFGAAIVKMIDLSKTGPRDFFDIIINQKNPKGIYLLPKNC